MKTYVKKQLTITLERPALRRLTNLLDQEPVTGYSVVPLQSGKGSNGVWSRDGMIGDAGQMLQLVCILDPNHLEEVLDDVFELVSPQQAIVTVQDVEVIRPEHF